MPLSGRLVLIKSVIASIPTYVLSIFKMPVGVALAVEKLQRGFLWGDDGSKRKIHAIKWKEVCKSKSAGGLGIGRVQVNNSGLLVKWIWRFGKEKNVLWCRVLVVNYGILERRLLWSWTKSSKDSFFVKAVRIMFQKGSSNAKIIAEGFSTVVGKGDRVEFWSELKWDSRSLSEAFPRVFALASKKSGPIQDFGRCFGFLNRNGLYTVSSFKRSVERNLEVSSSIHKVIWNGICASKVEVFLCQLYRGRVLVREVLAHLSVVVCPLCSLEVETVDHLFLLCPWTLNLWKGGKGVVDSVTVLMLNLKECYMESRRVKKSVIKDWVLPLMNTFKFNVDGSVRGSSGQAEVMAIHKAIEICSSSVFLGGQVVSIMSDSQVAVSWIHNEDFGSLDQVS
ncbi:hypothetical protein Ddye_015894 [Dipteronia dyeriana]|uniref:Reverse transcriptase zinc-binding domain-containing protein n=1 Tax=Dipteronia dyeriana TaxID=168575 RepID=A0AAD9WZZ4_9ROSI|nr:hypothetical protein Ddye_015894 [Dipteronia dyeriana]